MAKKNLHPEWHKTKIFCDGKLVLEVGTTKKELYVDIWSGNHPFYTGSQKIFVLYHSGCNPFFAIII